DGVRAPSGRGVRHGRCACHSDRSGQRPAAGRLGSPIRWRHARLLKPGAGARNPEPAAPTPEPEPGARSPEPVMTDTVITDVTMDPLPLPLDYTAIERILPHRYP